MSGALNRSRYSFFCDVEGNTVGYNARTGIFALLGAEDAALLRSSAPVSDGPERTELLRMGFLHDGSELGQVGHRFATSRNRTDGLHLAIAPTMACDFCCAYCYEKHQTKTGAMSPATQDALLRYLERSAMPSLEAIRVSWFGGEPLLALDVVASLTRRIQVLADQHGVQIGRPMFISNGNQLTDSAISTLKDVGISRIQISFDSLLHDPPRTRGVLMSNGEPSQLLTNAIRAAEEFDHLSIRVNVGPTNLGDVPQIVNTLVQHGLGDQTSLGRITEYHDICACEDEITQFNHVFDQRLRTFSRIDMDTTTKLSQYGALFSRLKPKNTFCGAIARTMLVVGPVGDLYRCWHSLGCKAEAIGNLHSGIDKDGVDAAWQNFSPLSTSECRDCRVLPLCMGGCTHAKVFTGPIRTCEAIREQIEEVVNEACKLMPHVKPDLFGEDHTVDDHPSCS